MHRICYRIVLHFYTRFVKSVCIKIFYLTFTWTVYPMIWFLKSGLGFVAIKKHHATALPKGHRFKIVSVDNERIWHFHQIKQFISSDSSLHVSLIMHLQSHSPPPSGVFPPQIRQNHHALVRYIGLNDCTWTCLKYKLLNISYFPFLPIIE